MNKFTLPALVLVLLTIPQIVDAQQRGRGGRQQQNPIEMILLQADSLELALTGDQTSQLTTMQGQLDEANAPAQQAMAALFEQASPALVLPLQRATHKTPRRRTVPVAQKGHFRGSFYLPYPPRVAQR